MNQDIKDFIIKLEQFNAETQEDEIVELTGIVDFIMNLGAGLTPELKQYFGDNTPVNFEKLNCLIDSIDTNKMKFIYSSGILRYTYSYKQSLIGWDSLRLKVYHDCLAKGVDVNDCLYGLLEGMKV